MELAAFLFAAAACWQALVWAKLRRAGRPKTDALLAALASVEAELVDELRRRAEGAGVDLGSRLDFLGEVDGAREGNS